jgi:hypothetical protein
MQLKYIFLQIILAAFITGCSTKSDTSLATCTDSLGCNLTGSITTPVDKLEIYHFHGTSQCYSCKTVGAYAEETVNTYFKEELDSGKIAFGHINIDLIENRELVVKYGATGSSLWLGTYRGAEFEAEEDINVWYKIQDKEAYMAYLKGVIEQKLAGN